MNAAPHRFAGRGSLGQLIAAVVVAVAVSAYVIGMLSLAQAVGGDGRRVLDFSAAVSIWVGAISGYLLVLPKERSRPVGWGVLTGLVVASPWTWELSILVPPLVVVVTILAVMAWTNSAIGDRVLRVVSCVVMCLPPIGGVAVLDMSFDTLAAYVIGLVGLWTVPMLWFAGMPLWHAGVDAGADSDRRIGGLVRRGYGWQGVAATLIGVALCGVALTVHHHLAAGLGWGIFGWPLAITGLGITLVAVSSGLGARVGRGLIVAMMVPAAMMATGFFLLIIHVVVLMVLVVVGAIVFTTCRHTRLRWDADAAYGAAAEPAAR